MEVLNLREAPRVPFKLNGRILCTHRNIQIVHLTLKPEEKIDKHINENDVIFFILEGKALLVTDNVTRLVCKDDCIKVEAGISRGFDNISVADFKLMVIKFIPDQV